MFPASKGGLGRFIDFVFFEENTPRVNRLMFKTSGKKKLPIVLEEPYRIQLESMKKNPNDHNQSLGSGWVL